MVFPLLQGLLACKLILCGLSLLLISGCSVKKTHSAKVAPSVKANSVKTHSVKTNSLKTSSNIKKVSPKAPSPGGKLKPYGAWWLTNPQAVRKNVVVGGLIICDKAMASKQPRPCKNNEYTLVILQKAKGQTCTDYISTGKFTCEQGKCYGHLIHEDEIDMLKITQDGKRLIVTPTWSKKMIFERSTPESINQGAQAVCRKKAR